MNFNTFIASNDQLNSKNVADTCLFITSLKDVINTIMSRDGVLSIRIVFDVDCINDKTHNFLANAINEAIAQCDSNYQTYGKLDLNNSNDDIERAVEEMTKLLTSINYVVIAKQNILITAINQSISDSIVDAYKNGMDACSRTYMSKTISNPITNNPCGPYKDIASKALAATGRIF